MIAPTLMKPPHILLFYDDLTAPGGAERLFLEEERYLRERGFRVTTAVFALHPDGLFDYQPDTLIHLRARGHFARLYHLVRLLWRVRPDLVIAPSNSEAVYLFLASFFAPVRYVAHVHGSHFWFETDRLKYAWLHRKILARVRDSLFGHREFLPPSVRLTFPRRLANEAVALLDYFALRRARALIALTNQVAWEIELLYGRKSAVCRGCLSAEWLALGRRLAPTAASTRDPRRIFSVGRLDPRKRIDVLLRAFALLARDDSTLRLSIGGTGPESSSLRALAHELGLDDRVEFLGFVPDADLPAHYLRASVFAFPSWTTSGITPYEALAFGCKVVWTSEAEEPVLALPGVHVADPTVEAFAAGLRAALADTSIVPLDELARYSWRHYFAGVEAVLNEVLHRAVPRTAPQPELDDRRAEVASAGSD